MRRVEALEAVTPQEHWSDGRRDAWFAQQISDILDAMNCGAPLARFDERIVQHVCIFLADPVGYQHAARENF